MSDIQIEIINVEMEVKPTKVAGKTYNLWKVVYKNKSFQDKVEEKKQAGFVAPQVEETLKSTKYGDKFTVVREKDGDYWKWIQLKKEGDEVMIQPQQGNAVPVSKAPTPTPKSTYETPEERAARQVMIVRQSSISSAVAALKVEKAALNSNDVINMAKDFENYVLGKNPQSFADMPDDLPFAE